MSAGFERGFEARSRLEALIIEETNTRQIRDSIEERLLAGAPVVYSEIYEMRQLTQKLGRLDHERQRVRNGFANWLSNMGLVPPEDLFKY